ncbi:MAG TPA: acetyl-CoA decarbonylase/synthase complex subunit gamma [Candidatus Lokiarchaeia archaeon]|nr:acetyl-CoA decarbonylase/synthase complex subunit gamma [Candidatus Lokiarchaeia archaeon]
MVKRVNPLEIYKNVPKGIDFKKYGLDSGMAFVTQLLERKVKIDDIAELKDPKNAQAVQKIREMTTPPQKPVVFGTGKRACTIGGEEVMYRHELTFFNKTAIAIDIHDMLDDAALQAAVDHVTNFMVERIGEQLRLEAIAIRCVSGDAATFKKCVEVVSAKTEIPLILCSFDAKVLDGAARAIAAKKPLLYAATKENWKDVGKLARELGLPVVAFSTDFEELLSVANSLSSSGIVVAVDPGVIAGDGLIAQSINKVIMLRTAALENGTPTASYPVIAVPAATWIGVDVESLSIDDLHELQYKEANLACMLLSMDTSLLICHTGRSPDDVWFLMGLATLRQNLFVDPRIYPAVDPGLIPIGSPTDKSPLLVTTNYRMTKVPVEEDLKSAGLNCWLLVVDTGGIGVESSTAGGQFNADAIAEALKKYNWQDKVSHNTVIIPGMSARVSGALEEASGGRVLVGPNDSSGIPKFLEKMWTEEGPVDAGT